MTEYTICKIENYSNLHGINAILCKRFDNSITFYANIKKVEAENTNGDIIVCTCDKNFSLSSSTPFPCYLPENKSFEELKAGDVITAVFF